MGFLSDKLAASSALNVPNALDSKSLRGFITDVVTDTCPAKWTMISASFADSIIMLTFCKFFFFSSRRRHTRWNCDWSSDVCSSDLRVSCSFKIKRCVKKLPLLITIGIVLITVGGYFVYDRYVAKKKVSPWDLVPKATRSEERRVGKECKSRQYAYDQKNEQSASGYR